MSGDLPSLLALVAVGFLAGTAGGLVGLGGSIVIIPVLTLVLGQNQHLAQAAAMIVNVFVSVPAALAHARAGSLRPGVVRRILPFGVVFILLGVSLSNRIDGEVLKKIFGIFLLYAMILKVLRLYAGTPPAAVPSSVSWTQSGAVGSSTGFVAGLLGIGGGPIAVPLLQRICRLPLRESIATSSAVMCGTSLVGAVNKNLTLGTLTDTAGVPLGLQAQDSVLMAAVIAPTAVLGAIYGAGLTHRLPLQGVRIVFILIMSWASAMMLGLIRL